MVDAARSFTALLVLSTVVAAFLVVQGRVDQGDPRLLNAPVDHDYLDFS
jgi:hypothetical protein